MAFADTVRTLGNQIEERRKHVLTEEAVKQALILPFLSALGFDIWNPSELIPEYKAGWAKNNEKIDYCLCLHGKACLFVEAKGPNETLTNYDAQLAKYFNSTPEVKFSIITNGIQYRFFTDLQEPNLLDKKPFFEFDFESFNDADVAVLERFRKDVFSVDNLVGYAEDLVFLGTLKKQFMSLLREPSDEFVSFAVKEAKLLDGRVTQKVIDRFRPLVKESISAAVLEIVQQSLVPQSLNLGSEPNTVPAAVPVDPIADQNEEPAVARSIITTEEELRAFEIVKAAVVSVVPDADAVVHNDTQSYFSVQYRVTTRWFARFFIQDRERKIGVVRLELDAIRALCPDTEWEAAPGGGSRAYFNDVEEIAAWNAAFADAAKSIAG